MQIKLKPQWIFRLLPDQTPVLSSEINFYTMQPEQVPLLEKLREGLNSDDITEAEFPQIEELNRLGFLTLTDETGLTVWEQHGASSKHVQEQLKHITFMIVDTTKKRVEGRELVSEYLHRTLIEAGLKESVEKPRITLLVADSYLELPNFQGTALPIIVNRLRPCIGPVLFPWRRHVREIIAQQPHYINEINYDLPQVFDDLQKSWLAATVLHFVVCNNQKLVNHLIDYNMTTKESLDCPILF